MKIECICFILAVCRTTMAFQGFVLVPKVVHRSLLKSPTSIATKMSTNADVYASQPNPESLKDLSAGTSTGNDQIKQPWLKSIDGICYVSYLCNVLTLSLPVILLPMAATDFATKSTKATSVAAIVAGVSSIATLGGAVGKFVNGFICQRLGSYTSSKLYMVGLAFCSAGLSVSTNPTTMGLFFAGMEFFASIQWAALAVMLTNYYEKSPREQLTAALTSMGLSSTSGQILAKTGGVVLASALQWRFVAQIGAAIALFGGWAISMAPIREGQVAVEKSNESFFKSIGTSLQALLTSKLFWMLSLAHSMAFVARGTDRILGTFLHELAGLPQSLAGGLTLSITLGLVHGLVTGSKRFTTLSRDTGLFKRFLARRYALNIAATLGLTAVATTGISVWGGNKLLATILVSLLSASMASGVAYQYFQFPSMIAKLYGEHKAVCISFLDGFGFLLSAPIFAVASKLVPTQGWSSTWGMLAALFAAAGVLMMSSITPILDKENQSKVEAASC